MKSFFLFLLSATLCYGAAAQCAAPTITASGSTTFCPGGSVTLSAPASNAWTQKADFGGTARFNAAGFSIGSKGYIGTGSGSSGTTKDFWEYDPATNVWTQKADFGGRARAYATGLSIGSKGYIGTGAGSSYYKDFWEYDPATNVWTQKADFGGTARYYATGFSIGNKGYIGTGNTGGSDIKDFWEYNPATNVWTQKADFGGTARYSATGFSIGSKGYIGTGSDYNGKYKDFWEYNPSTNIWTQKADFGGTARFFATGFSIGSKGYMGTGFNDETVLKDFWEYDPSTNVWVQRSDFGGTARYAATGFSIGSKGYIGTGSNAGGIDNNTKDFWEFEPGYTYSWSPGGQTTSSIAATTAGNYTVTTTNALGCSATSAATTVTIKPATQITTQPQSTTACKGSSASFSVAATGSNIIYKWYKDGQLLSNTTPTLTINIAQVSDAGSYTVSVIGDCGTVTSAAATLKVYDNINGAIYVDNSIAASGNGASWSTPYKELRDALQAAGNCSSITTINVAKGTYKPTNDANRDSTFAIYRGGLKIYGGYPTGGGIRNSTANPTILSGDIGTAGNSSDNSYHVVVIAGLTSSADSLVLDGFTLRDGNANGSAMINYGSTTAVQSNGAGACLVNNANVGKIALRSLIISNHTASFLGAGFEIKNSSPSIINCSFSNNSSSNDGGGINNEASSAPKLTNCVFSANAAGRYGGGISNYSSSAPVFTNCTFSANSAINSGGGMFSLFSNATITNCIFWANTAGTGPGIYNNNSTPVVTFSDVQGGYAGTGNISSDPLFINSSDADGADNIFGTSDDGLLIACASPATNTGTAINAPATDIVGTSRPIGSGIDMGAYEQTATITTPVITASGSTAFCPGSSVVLTSSAAITYQWYKDGAAITSATSSSYAASVAGSYAVMVTNSAGCSATSPATLVTANSSPVTPAITASGSTTLCPGGSVTLSAPASNTWTQKTDFGGVGRHNAVGFSIGSKGYIGTGYDNSYRKDFWEYDPATDAWTQKADFGGTARSAATGFSIGSKGYIGTGDDGKDFWEYDPTTNAWTQKADFGGTARYGAVGFSIGSKGYIGTGHNNDGSNKKDFWEYDPTTNAWTQKADFSGIARYFATGFSIGSKGYIGTGYNGGFDKDFWEYNPTTNAWTQKADFGGVARLYAYGFGIGSKGYIGTGTDFSSNKKDFWEYDPARNAWTQKVDFGGTARYGAVGFSIGSKGYIATGTDGSNKKDFWEYDPGYTYSWSPGGQTTPFITVTASGNYTVTTTNAAGCSAMSAATTVMVNTPVTPVITASGSTTLCPGGIVMLSAPASNAWTQKTDFGGTARVNATGFSIGSKGYIGTGYDGSSYKKDFWEYDPSTNAWTQKADFGGTARYSATGFSIGSKGYIGTGTDGNNKKDFWEYDPAMNTWTPKADFGGMARYGASSFGIGSKGYIGIGNDGSNKKDFWEYDPSTNAWTQKTDFGGTARYVATGFCVGSKGYIGTGYDGNSKKDFWEYDPATNAWTQKADFGGTARYVATGFSIGNKGYIGNGSDGSNKKDFWEYDPATNAWTQKADFGGTARYNATGFSIGSKGYIGTGTDGSNRKDFWEYDPGYTYSWSPGGQTTSSVTATTTGNYTVTTTNALGCSATSAATAVTVYNNNNGAIYVDGSVSASGDGTSWSTAYKELSEAIRAAGFCSSITTINVAKGTYKPTNDANRDSTFTIYRGGLKIYGGYPSGGGTRNVSANPTILSGDIGAANDTSDNSYHVMVIAGIVSATDSVVVDGFTLQRGTGGGPTQYNYNGQAIWRHEGSGMMLWGNGSGVNIAVRNCLFTQNYCVAGGGIAHILSSANLVLANCNFSGNKAVQSGGGVYNYSASADLSGCIFSNNYSTTGGGLYEIYGGSLRVKNCQFLNNHSGAGGAIRLLHGDAKFVSTSSIYVGNTSSSNDAGALSLIMDNGTDTLINNLFIRNVALGGANNGGGAIVQENGTSTFIANNTFYADSAASNSGAIRFKSGGSNRYLYNNIFYKSYNGTSNTDVSLESGTTITAQSNNLYSTTNPSFINEADLDGADNIFGTSDDGLRLQVGSPAQNTGSNAAIPPGIITDITGAVRIYNCTVDMGAYEVIDNINTYWTGLVSNDWNTAGNWCSSVPSSGAFIVIPVSAPYSPRLTSSVTTGNLLIATGTGLSLNGNTLTLAGTISGTGVLTGSPASSLIINGSGDAGTLYFDPATDGTTNALSNMTVNRTSSGTVTLGNKLNLTGTYTPTAGVLSSYGYLNLKSNATGTASVAAGAAAGGYITGNVIAERYTDGGAPGVGRRAWRLLSSPVTGSTIYDDWQESGITTNGYGTLITGEGLTPAQASAEGFDYVGGGNHTSIKQYDSIGNAWVPLSTNNTTGTRIPIRSHLAYMVFVRGDRTVNSTAGKSPATLRALGTLLQGTQTVALSPGTFTLAGNPYPSSLDFGKLYSHNTALIQNQFYVWNSKIGTYGAYVLVKINAGNTAYQATPSPFNVSSPGDDYKYIPSGSGFFLFPATGITSGNVTIQETDKASGTPPVNPFRELPSTVKELRVNLNLKDADTSVTLADGFLVQFDNYFTDSAAQVNASSVKTANFNENLAVMHNTANLIVDARPDVQKTDTLFMKLWYVVKRNYQFQVKGDNFASSPGMEAWLEDSYLGTKQPVSLSGDITNINFSVTSDSLSWKSNRFRIVFQNNSLTVLPVVLTSVKAAPANGGVNINWTVTNEVNLKGYTVQRSADGGKTYTDISIQIAKNGAAITAYNSFDPKPVQGDNMYRIGIEATNGTTTYSQSVKVAIWKGSGTEITVYPNPATTKATVHINKITGNATITLTDAKGHDVWKKENVTDTDTVIPVAHLANGTYLVTIKSSGSVTTLKLVKAD